MSLNYVVRGKVHQGLATFVCQTVIIGTTPNLSKRHLLCIASAGNVHGICRMVSYSPEAGFQFTLNQDTRSLSLRLTFQ